MRRSRSLSNDTHDRTGHRLFVRGLERNYMGLEMGRVLRYNTSTGWFQPFAPVTAQGVVALVGLFFVPQFTSRCN